MRLRSQASNGEEGEEKAENTTARVFLPSMTPPLLEPISSQTPIIVVIKFVEKFAMYKKRGGNVKFINCLSDPVLNRLEDVATEKGKNLSQLTEEEAIEFLGIAYAPTNKLAAMGVLKSLKCYQTASNDNIVLDNIYQYTKLFVCVANTVHGLKLSRDSVVTIFLANLNHEAFAAYLAEMNMKGEDIKNWVKFVKENARDFYEIREQNVITYLI